MNIKILKIIGLLTFAIPIYTADLSHSIDNDDTMIQPIHIIHTKSLSSFDRMKMAHKELKKLKLNKKSISKLEYLHSVNLPDKATIEEAIHTIFNKDDFDKQEIKKMIFHLSSKLESQDQDKVDTVLKKYNLEEDHNKVFKLLIKNEYDAHNKRNSNKEEIEEEEYENEKKALENKKVNQNHQREDIEL